MDTVDTFELDDTIWEFPCEFPLKVMGPSHAPLEEIILSIVQTYVNGFSNDHISTKPSRTGKYKSITAIIQFSDKTQVIGVYTELAKHQEETDHISLVL